MATTCKICGKSFSKAVSESHLKRHGITKLEYQEKYASLAPPPEASKKRTRRTRIRDLIDIKLPTIKPATPEQNQKVETTETQPEHKLSSEVTIDNSIKQEATVETPALGVVPAIIVESKVTNDEINTVKEEPGNKPPAHLVESFDVVEPLVVNKPAAEVQIYTAPKPESWLRRFVQWLKNFLKSR